MITKIFKKMNNKIENGMKKTKEELYTRDYMISSFVELTRVYRNRIY